METYFCNPLNLEYRYQIKDTPAGKTVFREAADPTMVVFRGKYLLFCSVSGGFWYSDDLMDWQWTATTKTASPKVPFSAQNNKSPHRTFHGEGLVYRFVSAVKPSPWGDGCGECWDFAEEYAKKRSVFPRCDVGIAPYEFVIPTRLTV